MTLGCCEWRKLTREESAVFALHSLYLHHQEYRVHAGERTFTLDATIVAFCCFRDDRSMIMIIFGRVARTHHMCVVTFKLFFSRHLTAREDEGGGTVRGDRKCALL